MLPRPELAQACEGDTDIGFNGWHAEVKLQTPVAGGQVLHLRQASG